MLAFRFLPLSPGKRSFCSSSSESDSSSEVEVSSSSPPQSLSEPLSSTSATSWQSRRLGETGYYITLGKRGALHPPSRSPAELHPHARYQSVQQEPPPSAPSASGWPRPSEVKNSAAFPALKAQHKRTGEENIAHVTLLCHFCSESEATVLTAAPGDSLRLQRGPGLGLQEKLLSQTWGRKNKFSFLFGFFCEGEGWKWQNKLMTNCFKPFFFYFHTHTCISTCNFKCCCSLLMFLPFVFVKTWG